MMDLKSMERKDLQSLCKQHGIPANTTNLAMIESLSVVLQVEEKVGAKRKGCLRGSGGSSGDDLGKKTVTFLLEGGEESDFEFVEKSKRRRMSGVVAAGRRRGSEGSESERGVGGRRTRSRGLGEMVVWSPVVGKTKAVEQVEGVRRNVDEEEIGATRSLRNREVVGDTSRKGSLKRKANGKGENVEVVPSRSRSANSEEVLGDGDGDVGRSKKRRKKDVDVVSGKGVGKEVVMELTRRSTRNSSNVVDDGTSSEMGRESVKEKNKLGKEAKGSEDVALVPTRRATRSSATLSDDGTSSSIVEKPVKGGEAIRKGRRHKQGIVSAPKADIEAVTEPVRRTTRSSSTFVEDGTSLTVGEKLVSEGKTIKKGKSQKQGKVPASVLNSVSVVEPVRRTTRTSSTLVEGGTFLPTQVAKRVKSRKQGKAAVSLADTEVIIEPTRRMTRNSSTLVEDGASLVTKVAKKAKSEKQANGRALASGDSIASLPGNESVTEPIRRSTRSSSKSSEGETTSASKQGDKEAAAVITPGRRSTKSSLKLSEGATASGRKSTRSSLKLAAGETSSVLRQGDKEEAATISGRRQIRSYLKLSEGEISSVSKLEDKEEAAMKSGKRSTRSSSKLSEGDTKHTTELGDKQEAMTTSGKRSTRRFSKFLESEASSVTKLGDKEEAVPIPEWRSTRSSSKLLEDVSSVPLLSSDNNSVRKDKSGKQATSRALKSGDLKAPLLEATTSSTTTRKSMRSSKQQDLTAASPVNEALSTVTRRATRGSSKGLEDASATSAVRRDKSEKKATKSASKGSSQAPSSPVIEAVTTPTRRSTPSSLNLSEGETLLEVEKLGDESSASLLYSPTVTESTRTTHRSSIWNMFKSPSVCVEVDDGGESVQKIKYGGQTSLHSSGGRPTNDSILSSEVERVYGEAQGNSASNKSETRSATTIGFRGKENESDTIEMSVEGKVGCMSNTEPTDAVKNLPQDNEYCPSDLPKVSCKITEERSSGDCSNVKLSPNSSSETLEQVEIEVENLCGLHLSVGSEENMPMSGIEAPAVLGNEGSTEQEDIIPDGEDTRYLAEQQRDTTSAVLDVNSVDSSHKSIEPEAMKQLDEDTEVTPDITTTVNFNIGSGESLEFIEVVGEAMENVESRIERHDDGEDTRYLAEQQRDTTSAVLDVNSVDSSHKSIDPEARKQLDEDSDVTPDITTTVNFNIGSGESLEFIEVDGEAMENVESRIERHDDGEDTRYLAEQQRDTTSAVLDVNSVDSSLKSIEPEAMKQLDEDTDVTPDITTTVNFNVGSGESREFIEVVGEAMENVESRIERHDDGEDTRYLAEQQRDTTSAVLDVNSVDSSLKSIEPEAMKQLDEDTDVTPDITTTVNFNVGSGESREFIEVVGEAMENVESRIERHDDGEDTRYLAEQQRDTTSAVLDVNSVDSSHKSIEPEAMKQLDEDTDVTPDITTTVNFNIGSGESLEFIEVVGEAMENVESRIERHDGTSMKKADEIILDKFDHSDEVEEKKDDGVETVEDERKATTVPISPSESPALGLIFGDQLTENFAQSSPEMIMDNATTGGFHGNEYESDTIEMSVEGRDVSIHDIESPNVERSLPKDNEHYPSHLAEAPCEIIEEMSSGDCRNVIISPHWSSEPLKKVEFDVENLPTVRKSVGPEENMTIGGIEAPAMLGNEGSTEQEDGIAADDEHARNHSEHQIDITSASLDVDSVGNSPKSMEHKAMEQLNEVTVVSLDTTTTANFDIGSQGSIALDQVIGEDVASNLSPQTAGQERILQMENSPPTLNENVQSFMKIDDEVVEVVDIKGALEETQNSEEFQTSVTPIRQADLQEGEVTESPTFNKEGFSATTGLANLSPQSDAKSNDENEVVLSTSNAHEELDVRKEVQKDIAEVSPLNHECLSEAKVMIPADASECKEAGKEEASILGSVNLVDKYDEGNFTAALESTVENADNASTKDQNKNSDLGTEMDKALPDADQPLVGRQREIGSCIRESMSTVVTGQAEKQMDIFLSQLDCKTEADGDATECRKYSETKLDLRGSEVTAGSTSIYGIDITGGGDISEEANCGDKFESIERTSNVTEAWDEPGASAMFVNELFHIDSEVAGFANNNSQVGQWECRFQEENFGRSERESFMEVSTSEALATREDEHMSSSSFEHYLRMDYHDSGVIPLEKNLSQELNDVNENEEQFKLQEQRTTIQEASDVSQLTKDGMVTVSDCSKLGGRLEESTLVEQERVRPYINESEDSEPGKAFFTSQNALNSSDVATGRSGSTSKIQESEANKKYFEDFCWSGSDALPEDSLKSTMDVNKE